MDQLWQDLRYATRALRKSPGYTAAAVLLLALGIGATTTIFSVVYALLLRPLPYPHANKLVRFVRAVENSDVSIPEYQFWKDHSSAYASLAAYRGSSAQNIDAASGPEWIQTIPVSAGFFQTLGIEPSRGREFTAEETAPNGRPAIILTDGLWRNAFGSRQDIVGRVVTMDDASYIVTGVLPPAFWFPIPGDAFVPLRFLGGLTDRGSNTQMIGRLKEGVSLRQAAAEAEALNKALLRAGGLAVLPNYRGLSVGSYQDSVATDNGDSGTRTLLLFGAVLLLLLIACSNLGGLLLARLATRRKEIAVRLALGSSTWRLVRQYLMENAVLSVSGGAAGLLAAAWLLKPLLALFPVRLTTSAPVELNQPALLFALAAVAVTNLLFGLAPLVASARFGVAGSFQASGRIEAPRQRTRSALVASEVALSVTLLVSAALLIQSLYRLRQEKLGFSSKGLMAFLTPPSRERRGKPEELRRFETQVLDRISTLPNVSAAAGTGMLPFAGPNNLPAHREGHPEQSYGGTEIRPVTSRYFATMGIPILRGRGLTDQDSPNAEPVVLISQSLADRWWPGGDPIGDRLVIGDMPPRTIVGVVGDTKRMSVKEPYRPTVYVTPSQYNWTGAMFWVLRGNFSSDFAQQIQAAIREIDPRQRVLRIRTMDDIVAASVADSRFDAWIFGIFAGIALLLTAVGIYGLLSFSVAGRFKEIGTRMALGASAAQVLRLVLGQGTGTVVIGLIIGLAGGSFLSRALSSLLFGVQRTDAFSYASVAIVVLGAGVLASYLPARRASQVDPVVALRSE